jgi:hypothetical protein
MMAFFALANEPTLGWAEATTIVAGALGIAGMAGVSWCTISGLAGSGFGSCASIFRGNSATGCGGGSFKRGTVCGEGDLVGNINCVVTYLGGAGVLCN